MMNIFNLNFYFYYIIHLKLFDFKNWPDNFDRRLYLKEMLIINVINVSFLFIFVGNGIIEALVSYNRGFLCYLLKETLINVINVSFLFILIGNGLGDLG